LIVPVAVLVASFVTVKISSAPLDRQGAINSATMPPSRRRVPRRGRTRGLDKRWERADRVSGVANVRRTIDADDIVLPSVR